VASQEGKEQRADKVRWKTNGLNIGTLHKG
jgi:hypothetical protein